MVSDDEPGVPDPSHRSRRARLAVVPSRQCRPDGDVPARGPTVGAGTRAAPGGCPPRNIRWTPSALPSRCQLAYPVLARPVVGRRGAPQPGGTPEQRHQDVDGRAGPASRLERMVGLLVLPDLARVGSHLPRSRVPERRPSCHAERRLVARDVPRRPGHRTAIRPLGEPQATNCADPEDTDQR
jgi:hypothetical protein